MMMKNSSEAMSLRFESVEVVNISNFSNDEIYEFVNNKKNSNPNHLFLMIPFDAEAEISNADNFDNLIIKTDINQKEDLEYFLEYIKNINNAFPNLSMQVQNSFDFEDLELPIEIKLL
jgi:hypothetical protein